MKVNKWGVFSLAGMIALLCSCTAVYVNEISRTPDFNLNTPSPKTVIVIGVEDFALNDYVKTFYKNYSDSHKFVVEYVKRFTGELLDENVFAKAEFDTSYCWGPEIYYSYFANDKRNADSVLIRPGADYLIRISHLEIGNTVETNVISGDSKQPPIVTPKEYCVVKARFQLIDLKTKQCMLEFESKGKSNAFLFAYGLAFKSAINKSFLQAIEFLRTGEKEF